MGFTTGDIIRLDVDDIFDENGPVADTVDNYRKRNGQVQLARQVKESITKQEPCIQLADAPTGVGKTLGYLLPSLISKPVIVATGNKSLQDQIMNETVRQLRQIVDRPIRAERLKGFSNYLCRRELENEVIQHNDAINDPKSDIDSMPDTINELQAWNDQQIEHGPESFSESDFLSSSSRKKGRELTVTSKDCLKSDCKFYDECHPLRKRESVHSADIIVVNHSLYLAARQLDVNYNVKLLPDPGVVIVDEAHDIMSNYHSMVETELSKNSFKKLSKSFKKGMLNNSMAKNVLNSLGFASEDSFDSLIKEKIKGVGHSLHTSVIKPLEDYYIKLEDDTYPGEPSDLNKNGRVPLNRGGVPDAFPLKKPKEFASNINECIQQLDYILDRFKNGVGIEAVQRSFDSFSTLEPHQKVVASYGQRLKKYMHYLELIKNMGKVEDSPEKAIFYEKSAQSRKFVIKPILVRDNFPENQLDYDNKPEAVVYTSATLSDERDNKGSETDFGSFLIKTGFDNSGLTVRESCVESAFNHQWQTLYYEPKKRLPYPTQNGQYSDFYGDDDDDDDDDDGDDYSYDERRYIFYDKSADIIANVSQLMNGGVFVLCTSYQGLNSLHAKLKLRKFPQTLLSQDDLDRTTIMKKMKGKGDYLLCATKTFFEGVDLKGDNLEAVFLDKLPFRYRDPKTYLGVKESYINEETPYNFWKKFEFPYVSELTRQAKGRGVRTENDRSLFCILSSRYNVKRYGDKLFRALPDADRVETIGEVKRWLQHTRMRQTHRYDLFA